MGGKLASEYALLNSPVFIGSPKVPTAVDGDVSKQIANTEFVMQAVSTAPATKLETGRYFSVDGIVTSEPALFDGTKDVSIVVTDIDGANIKNVNASTVNGFVVEANVPKDAVFTDTVYEHPISNIGVNEETIYVGFKADAFGHIINTYEASQMEFNIQGNAKTADSLRRRVNIAYTGAITGSVSTRFAKVTEPVPVRIPIPELDEEGKEVYNFTQIIKSNFTLYANYVESDYADLLDNLVPDVIDNDIELPTRRDYFEYNWDISDPSLLSYGGVYNPDIVDRVIGVTLTMNVSGSEETIMFEKNVTIKKYELKKLVKGDIVVGYTSSWYYSGYSEEVLNTVDVLNISFAYFCFIYFI